MKFKLEIEQHYPHPITDVWEGITTNEDISDWLLDTNNFKAEAGHGFEMTCVNDDGSMDVYRCQVLEIEQPHRMLWSWVLVGKESEGLTEVEFHLKGTDTGTTVTLIHRGDRDKATIDRFKSGWPFKLDRLAETLAERANSTQ
jgi:uncharacterized protein YndB with AHSA1/START domain